MASCSSTGDTIDTTADTSGGTGITDTTIPEETGPVPEVPDKKWEGATFTIYDKGSYKGKFLMEESKGEVMADAIYDRMRKISELTGVEFAVVSGGSGDSLGTGAQNSIMAGDDAYQLVSAHGRIAFSYAQAGLTMDWNDLPYVDFDKPWWGKNMLEGLGVAPYLEPATLSHI